MPKEENGKPAKKGNPSKKRKKSGLGSYRKRKPASDKVREQRNKWARDKRARKMGSSSITWGSNQIDVYTPRSSCSSRSVSESGSESVSEPESESEYTKACNINEEELTIPYWKPPSGPELQNEIDQLLLDTNNTWVRVPEQKRKRNGGGTKKRRMTKKHKKSTRITRKRHNKKR